MGFGVAMSIWVGAGMDLPLVVPEVAILFRLWIGASFKVIAVHILHAAGPSQMRAPTATKAHTAVRDQRSDPQRRRHAI